MLATSNFMQYCYKRKILILLFCFVVSFLVQSSPYSILVIRDTFNLVVLYMPTFKLNKQITFPQGYFMAIISRWSLFLNFRFFLILILLQVVFLFIHLKHGFSIDRCQERFVCDCYSISLCIVFWSAMHGVNHCYQ